MLVICPVYDRVDLLPFYLRHYDALGATKYVVAMWNGRDNPLCHYIDSITSHSIEIRTSVACPRPEYNGPIESEGLNKIVAEFADDFPWYCLADMDEFCYFGGRMLPEVVREANERNFTAVHGVFFDRIAPDYAFPPIPDAGTLDDTFPLVCDFTRCWGANYNKVPLSRSNLPVESGHHWSKGNIWWNQAEVHHFKWTAGLLERLRERDMYFTAQGLPWAGESAKFLHVLTETRYMDEANYKIRPARKIGV